MTNRKTKISIGISRRAGLALMVIWPLLVVGLCAIGERLSAVYAALVLGSFPALLGAVAWFKMGQQHPEVLLQKRLILLLAAGIALSVPITRWPFQLAVKALSPALNVATKDKCDITESLLHTGCANAMRGMIVSLYRPKPLGRVGIWGAPVASGKDLTVLVTVLPGGAQLLLDSKKGWKILY